MNAHRQIIPVAGLLVVMAIGIYMVVRLNAQEPAGESIDLSTAALAEVRDARGQAVLSGAFGAAETDSDDIERTAKLEPAGTDPDAAGDAEIELSESNGAKLQEVEFSARNLQPGATFSFQIDGRVIATATANKGGEVEVERDVPLPGGNAPR